MAKGKYLFEPYSIEEGNREIPNLKTWTEYLYHPYKFIKFHWEMLALLKSNRFVQWEKPRGSAKSTLGQSYALHYCLENPNKNILYISNTAEQVQAINRESRGKITTRLEPVYGKLQTDLWSNRGFIISWRKEDVKGYNIFYIGELGPATGTHNDLIIFDDILDGENTSTAELRAKTERWIQQTVYPTMNPDCQILWINTRYHIRDYSGKLEQLGFVKAKGNTAIIYDENGNEESYWKERYSLADIYEQKKLGSITFKTQYMNDPSDLDDIILWQDSFWQEISDNEIENTDYLSDSFTMVIDPAFSEKQTSDYTALGIFAIPANNTNERHLIYSNRYKIRPSQILKKIIPLVNKYHIRNIIIESVFESQVLPDLIKDQFQSENTSDDISVYAFKPQGDKICRFLKSEGLFEQGLVKFCHNPEMKTECEYFGSGEGHDDYVDMLSCGLIMLNILFGFSFNDYVSFTTEKSRSLYEKI